LNETAVMNLPSQSVRLRYILPDNDPLYLNGGEYVYSLRAFKSETEFTETAMVINLDGQPPDTHIVSPTLETDNLNQIIRISGTALDKIGTQSSNDGIIRDLTLDIRWGSTHSVTIGSADIKGVSSWSYNFDSWEHDIGMQNGGEPVELSIVAEDYAGNTHCSSVTVNVDQSTDIPSVSVSNFADGDKKYGVFSVTGHAEDDDGILNVLVYLSDNTTDPTADVTRSSINLLNGKIGEWVKASGTDTWAYLLNLSQLEQGEYRFCYMAEDLNEKSSTYGGLHQGVWFSVDPDIPMIDFETDTYLTAAKTWRGTVTKTSTESDDVYVKRVEYKIIGTKSQSSWMPFVEGTNLTYQNNKQKATFTLEYTDEMIAEYGQGEVTIYIRATDNSDKQSEASDKIFVDTIAPTAALTSLAKNVIRKNNDGTSSVIISGGVSDEEPSSGLYSDGCSLKYSYDGQHYEQAVAGGAMGGLSSFHAEWNIPTTVKDGTIDIKLTATDRAGNITDEVRLTN
ncbi:MAG: hypothetical protein J6Y01_03850, partial [Spirochaetales bacterium]|nr:hypothetical protein [Spirochaetales bacterium]